MNPRPYKRVLLIIGIALVLPVLLVLGVQFSQLHKERQSIQDEALNQAKQISLLTDLQIQSHFNSLQMLATRTNLSLKNWGSAKATISAVSTLHPSWKNILIADAKTEKIVVSLYDEKIFVLPEEVKTLDEGKSFVGGITVEGEACPCIYIYTAIPSKKKGQHILAVALDPHGFQELMLRALPENTISAIVDKDARFIARWPNYESKLGSEGTKYLKDAIASGNQGIFRSVTWEGVENYTAFYTSPENGWSAHVAVASSLIDTPRMLSWLIGTIGVLLTLAVSFVAISYLLRQFETESSGRLSAIVQSSDDVIISKNLDGVITSWNAAAEKILGWSTDEAVGKHISLIIPGDRLPEENEIIRKVKSGYPVTHFETVRRKKDGSKVNLSITVSPIKDKHGIIIGASKVARDITERINTEIQLREERETLATLNNLAPRLSATQDLESLVQMATDEATKLTTAQFGAFFYNDVTPDGKSYLLYALSGAPREAFENFGMPRATAVFSPTFKGEGTVMVDDVTQDARYGKNKPHNGMPKGHLPVKSYLAVPVISRSGEVIGGLFFGHSQVAVFKERHARIAEGIAALAAVGIDNARLFEQVKHGQKKAEEANRAKSDFLATMSHEIRTPMNVIMGVSTILGASETLTTKQNDLVKALRSSADTLLQLLNDLLDISKIEAKSVELENVPFSLSQVTQEVVDMMIIRAREKGLEFVADDLRTAGHVFSGDPTRLKQIMVNLCSNAIKFTEQGKVTLSVMREQTNDPDITNVSIVVEDTGIGIPEDKQEKVFEKFEQADTSITRRYGGSGLGLSITKTLVELMNGVITLKSVENEGSIFTVSLPMRLSHEKHTSDGNTSIHSHGQIEKSAGKGNILLVEDYEPNILVATTFLEDLGYSYEVVRDGEAAIERIQSGEFDLILMDIQMPGMNGFQTTQKIRTIEKSKSMMPIKIIGVTAHALAGDREKCIQSGMNDYLAKPFVIADLKEKLETFLDKKLAA